MIFIVVKYAVKPESVDQWLDIVDPFTQATRAEEGNLWFDWFRSVEDPDTYLLCEGFRDPEAGSKHVNSAHFPLGLEAMRPHLLATPQIVSQNLPEWDGWATMGELQID
ncbi:MAG: antibiotic biosynthesis monooxygenase [Propionibacteriaceae bacterium]|jgi:quinol monooxygenase YgiN|nr:antibiotic biosynthesis monooxygenase [Propionibacteriaceae bacterium]